MHRSSTSVAIPKQESGPLDGVEVLIVVVSCTRCATQFQFDESRLPLEGAKVRCSRCREAFFLAHPQADSSTPILALETDPDGIPAAEAHADTPPEVETGQAASEADFDWDFDFNAQSEGLSSSANPTEPGAPTPATSAPDRSSSRSGEQTVFASVEDLADWLADRTDTLEPETGGGADEFAEPIPTPEAAPVAGGAVALGVLKKTATLERATDRAQVDPSRESPMEPSPDAGARGNDSGEGLLADLLGTSRAQVPRWVRVAVNGAVQVVGWGLTGALLTIGLVHGLWPGW